MLTVTDRTAINIWLNAIFCEVFRTVVDNVGTVSMMRYQRYERDTYERRDRLRFMLKEYYRVMGLTEASFDRGRMDDLHFVEEMLSSYNLEALCKEGGYEPVRLYCQRAILIMRFSSRHKRDQEIQQLNALEQIAAEMRPYCFHDLKSEYVTHGGDSLPSATLLGLLVDHFPAALIFRTPSDLWDVRFTSKLLDNQEQCRIAYQHPLMQEHVWYPLLVEKHFDFVSRKLEFYIRNPSSPVPYAHHDFPLAFWELFCMRYAVELTTLYHAKITQNWQIYDKRTPLLEFLMRHVWLLAGEHESPFVVQFCEYLLPTVQEELAAYFAEAHPPLPRSHLYYLVKLLDQQNFIMLLDTRTHDMSWPVDPSKTYLCDGQHAHFLTRFYGNDWLD